MSPPSSPKCFYHLVSRSSHSGFTPASLGTPSQAPWLVPPLLGLGTRAPGLRLQISFSLTSPVISSRLPTLNTIYRAGTPTSVYPILEVDSSGHAVHTYPFPTRCPHPSVTPFLPEPPLVGNCVKVGVLTAGGRHKGYGWVPKLLRTAISPGNPLCDYHNESSL